MKRTNSRPIILPLPTFAMHAFEAQPRILPFPTRGHGDHSTVFVRDAESNDVAPNDVEPKNSEPTNDELSAVRDRLFRMIVANQWDRSHGNRAS